MVGHLCHCEETQLYCRGNRELLRIVKQERSMSRGTYLNNLFIIIINKFVSENNNTKALDFLWKIEWIFLP